MKRSVCLAFFALSVAFVLAFTQLAASTKWPFTNDSSSFIEAADSFLAGDGFMKTPRSVERLDIDAVPLQSFPVGYPVLIAGIAALGVEVSSAAVWVANVSWMLVPCALVLAFRRAIGDYPAIVLGVLTSVSPGLINHGSKAVSDVPYMLFAIGSIGAMVRSFALDREDALVSSRLWLVVSGVLGGMAYLTRNAGVALIGATSAALLFAWMMRVVQLKEMAYRCVFWLLGLVPLATVQITRNLEIFGVINPYHQGNGMGSSQTSLSENLQDYLGSLLFQLTSSWRLYEIAHSHTLLVGVAVIGIVGILAFWLKDCWAAGDRATKITILLLSFYALAISAITVMAATTYSIEKIGSRFAMQYGWPVLTLGLIAFRFSRVWKQTTHRALIIGTVAALFALHLIHAWSSTTAGPQWNRILASDQRLIQSVKDIPTDAVIFSNEGAFLIIEARRKARHVPAQDANELNGILEAIAKQAYALRLGRPVYFVFLQPKPDPEGGMSTTERFKGLHPAFKLVAASDHAVFLRSSW